MELLQLNYGTMQSTDGRIWARSYDPLTGMWLTPDPAGQFSNPFGFGGDPVNYTDPDGLWLGIDDAIAAGVGFVIGAGVAISKGYNPTDGKFWGYAAGGAAIAWVTYNTAGAAAAAQGGGVSGSIAAGEAGGIVGGYGNYTLNSGIESGFDDYSVEGGIQASVVGGFSGAAGGAANGYLSTAGWNLFGRGGAAFGSGYVSSYTSGIMTGQSNDEALHSALMGGLSSWGADGLTYYAHKHFDPHYNDRFTGNDIAKEKNHHVGDIVFFAPESGFDIQSFITHEDYTHVGILDYTDGRFVLREANMDNHSLRELFGGGYSSSRTELEHFSGRNYSSIHYEGPVATFSPNSSGYYIQGSVNCTTAVASWTGHSYTNNPGVLFRTW